MTEESDLLLLFGKSAHRNIPVVWKELREELPNQSVLEEFFGGNQDEPFRYQQRHLYLFIPKTGQWFIRDIDPLSVCQWIWFFPEEEGGGISDRRLRQILAKAVAWAMGQGVAGITLTFPPCPRAPRRPWQRLSARYRRFVWLTRFMSQWEAQTGLILGFVTQERRRGHHGE